MMLSARCRKNEIILNSHYIVFAVCCLYKLSSSPVIRWKVSEIARFSASVIRTEMLDLIAVAVAVVAVVTVAVVAIVTVGAWDTVETTCSNAGADVISDVVDVDLTQIVAIGRHDTIWPVKKKTE
jgi:hypothetical protein